VLSSESPTIPIELAMSYRARTDIFQQYRRSYQHSSKPSDRFNEYTVLRVDSRNANDDHINEQEEDPWAVWINSLGRLSRYITEIEQKGIK